jgi:xylose isomerase
MLGSIDANRDGPQNGRDTDQSPTGICENAKAMMIVRRAEDFENGCWFLPRTRHPVRHRGDTL